MDVVSASAAGVQSSTRHAAWSPAPAVKAAPAKKRVANARLVARRRFEKPPRVRDVSVVSVSVTAPGFASFRPRAQRAQAARVKSTRRRRSRREFVLCGIAFAPVVGRRGRHFGADHFQTSSVAATDSLSEAAIRGWVIPLPGQRQGVTVESLRRGILRARTSDDAPCSLWSQTAERSRRSEAEVSSS